MSETILIVDDHNGVRIALREWLHVIYPQIHVIEAISGEEAIAIMEKETPRLVILDFKLPGMNGVEATRKIKSSFPRTPIVMLTIRDEKIYHEYAEEAGVSAYISKREVFAKLQPALDPLLSIAVP